MAKKRIKETDDGSGELGVFQSNVTIVTPEMLALAFAATEKTGWAELTENGWEPRERP